MGQALLGGILEAGIVEAKALIVSDIDKEKSQALSKKYQVNVAENNREVVRKGDIIILAVKPQVIDEVLKEIAPSLSIGSDKSDPYSTKSDKSDPHTKKLLISIAAGITTKHIESLVGNIPVIRIMPNILVKVREGISALCGGKYASSRDKEISRKIFAAVGKVVEVREELMDVVTALSGSGPAYIFLIIEILRDIGIKLGLSKEVATNLISQTVFGSAKMQIGGKEEPALLRDRVTSPGGTTERALVEKAGPSIFR